mgnify:CR=1 FL=1
MDSDAASVPDDNDFKLVYVYHDNEYNDYSGPDNHIVNPQHKYYGFDDDPPIDQCTKHHVVIVPYEHYLALRQFYNDHSGDVFNDTFDDGSRWTSADASPINYSAGRQHGCSDMSHEPGLAGG